MIIHGVKSIEFDGSSFILEIHSVRNETSTLFIAGNVNVTITEDESGNIVVVVEN